MREVERILFVRTDRIGDVLMNVPAIRLLRQTFPKSWITLLADRPVADLLRGQPDLDEVIGIDAAAVAKDWREWMRVARNLKRASFDVAIVSNPDKRLHLLVYFAGIPVRIGYKRKWGFLLTKAMPDEKARAGRHEIDLNLELASLASDRTWDGELKLAIDEGATRRIEVLFEKELFGAIPVVAIHAGTSLPAKRWAPERFGELAARLREAGFSVLLIGGEEEKETSSRVGASAGAAPPPQSAADARAHGALADWTGKLTLRELVAAFSHPRVRAVVSSDSGPAHVAWMSGTPVVTLFSTEVPGSIPARWGPRDASSETIHKPMRDISVDEVLAATLRVAAKKRTTAPSR